MTEPSGEDTTRAALALASYVILTWEAMSDDSQIFPVAEAGGGRGRPGRRPETQIPKNFFN